MEELTYRGYSLPRLEALTGRSWLALLIMTLGFMLQHVALPLVDWRYSITPACRTRDRPEGAIRGTPAVAACAMMISLAW